MRRYSPPDDSPSRRGYGGRARSSPRRVHGGGGYGRGSDHGSLLVRNIPLSTRPDELRVPFERFGVVRDVYIPKDYYSGEPRGFAFVEFLEGDDAAEAQYHMNKKIFAGREITVVVASESRKRPDDMRRRTGSRDDNRGSSRYGRRRSHHGRSRSRSVSRSPSPRHASGSCSRHRDRSRSPAPRRRGDHSISPDRRHADEPIRSPRDAPKERTRRSYSPGYENDVADRNGNGIKEKTAYESDRRRTRQKNSPRPASKSRSGSGSGSAD